MKPISPIPLCRSAFLQDFSIELGRRYAVRNPFWHFSVEVDTGESDEEEERLTVWGFTPHETGAQLTVWADGTVSIRAILRATPNNEGYRVGFYPKCDGFTMGQIAEAFRESVSVSTRLCYSESPLPLLRKIWKHRGKVETRGTLSKPRTD